MHSTNLHETLAGANARGLVQRRKSIRHVGDQILRQYVRVSQSYHVCECCLVMTCVQVTVGVCVLFRYNFSIEQKFFIMTYVQVCQSHNVCVAQKNIVLHTAMMLPPSEPNTIPSPMKPVATQMCLLIGARPMSRGIAILSIKTKSIHQQKR